jgi:hypothetical protein
MAIKKGQSAVHSVNNCQGQLQTPQSASVPATARSPTRSSRAKFCPRQVFVFPAEMSEIKKGLLNLYLTKPRQNSKATLKTNELCIDRDIHYIHNSFCKNMLKIANLRQGCELDFVTQNLPVIHTM